MRYYLDTEFHEHGYARIDLISIALVCEDGREYYAVASDGWDPETCSPWLKEHVLPNLGVDEGFESIKAPRHIIASEIREFIGAGKQTPEFWGYFADYDWVLFCQLFGRMIDLPKGWPMYCRDLKQEIDRFGIRREQLPAQSGTEHNALADARWIRSAHEWLLMDGGPST